MSETQNHPRAMRAWNPSIPLLLTALLLPPLAGQASTVRGKGDVAGESRVLEAFSAVDLALAAEVTYNQGSTHVVEISAQENLLPQILTEVKDGRLRIAAEGNLRTRRPIRITVTAPALDSVRVSGSGNFTTDSVLQGEHVSLAIAGSGKLKAGVEAVRVTARIAGSGAMQLAGRADAAELRISGSGKIVAEHLTAAAVQADIAGSGRIEAHADEALTGRIAGSGVVVQSGAAEPDVKVAGSGKVRRK